MKLGIRTISSSFYLCVSAMYGYSLWFNLTYVRVGNTSISTYGGYGGKFKYLTFWNLVRYFVSVQSKNVCGMSVCYVHLQPHQPLVDNTTSCQEYVLD